MSEDELHLGPYAIGSEALALNPGTLATRNAIWKVEGNTFSLQVGDANMVAELEKHERKVLFKILRKIMGQAQAQENRL